MQFNNNLLHELPCVYVLRAYKRKHRISETDVMEFTLAVR